MGRESRGMGTKSGCAGENQQQLTELTCIQAPPVFEKEATFQNKQKFGKNKNGALNQGRICWLGPAAIH
jgi:hypothetical protein